MDPSIIIHILQKWPTRCKCVGQFIISLFLDYSTCFERYYRSSSGASNCNYSFWFYTRLSLPAAVMAEWELVAQFIIPLFLDYSTCFGQYYRSSSGAYNCNYSFWFYTCLSLPAAVMAKWEQFPLSHDSGRQRQTCLKPEAVITVRRSWWWAIISLETRWAVKEQRNNKLSYTVATCWSFL
jgi:hypothetical protein